jgi:hypothetical protein
MYHFSCSCGLGVDRQNRTRTCYVELAFFHPPRSEGHIVHSGAFEA